MLIVPYNVGLFFNLSPPPVSTHLLQLFAKTFDHFTISSKKLNRIKLLLPFSQKYENRCYEQQFLPLA
jgi:hypothetical protein